MLVGLIKLGTKSSFTLPGISPPHGQIINALLNFPFEPFVDLWFPENSTAYLDTLSSIFEGLMLHLVPLGQEPLEETVFGGSIDELIIPIVLVLTKMAGHPLAQTIMKAKFMPNDIDRTKPLVELASVTGALVRSMSSIRLHQTKDLICELLVKILKGDCNSY